jgi:hypothetical protein
VVLEGRNAGTVMVKVGHGKKLKVKLIGRNALCAGEVELTYVLTVKEQEKPE